MSAMQVPANFGFVSAKHESGGRGVRTVSSGRGDPGGVSYGKHQLASLTGTMAQFVASPEGAPFRGRLEDDPGSEEFTAAYLELCDSYPDELEAAQLAFIIRTHFKPVYDYATKIGFTTSNRGVQEALYSISVQHGGAIKIVGRARPLVESGSGVAGEIKALYRARTSYVSGLQMPAGTKASILNRYRTEVNDAIAAGAISDAFA